MPPLQNIYCGAQVLSLLSSASVVSGPSKLEELKSFWSWWFQHKLPPYFYLWMVPLKSHKCRMKVSLAPKPALLREATPDWGLELIHHQIHLESCDEQHWWGTLDWMCPESIPSIDLITVSQFSCFFCKKIGHFYYHWNACWKESLFQ